MVACTPDEWTAGESRVQNELRGECWDAHLLHERIPPSCLLVLLLYERHWGLSRWRSGTDPRGHGPRPRFQSTATYGVVAARRPPMCQQRPTTHVPQPLLHWVRRYVPLRHFTDCRDDAADGAGPSECTAGVTPAPSENLRREQAPVPCAPAMASNHRQSREHAMTPPLVPTKTR